MSTIPEAAVEAARQAFGKHSEWRYRQNWNARGTCICGETLPETGNIHREFGYHQMTKVLEAAAHIIRQQIAAEIRAIPIGDFRTYDCLPSDYANMGRAGMKEKAARIAERSGE